MPGDREQYVCISVLRNEVSLGCGLLFGYWGWWLAWGGGSLAK